MEEQSDTPRTEMAEGQGLNPYFEGRFDGESDELCALRLTLARERDEARAIANDRDAMVDHRDRALTAIYQRVDVITQERDEAIAEVERLRSALRGLHDDIVEYQRIRMNAIQMTTLAILAGRWQAEADSGAGSPDRRVALRECADVLRMMCEMRFEDCPHAAPHRYCPECRVHPCPIGLDEGPKETT